MKPPWPMVRLGEMLTLIMREELVEPSKAYRLLGVRLEGAGPFLRETKLGSEISAYKLSRVQTGDFIYSRLFAWRGAFGIIDKILDGCFVSNEFPTFNVHRERLNSQFLDYWFRLPITLEKVAANCTGSTPLTRNRLKESLFLNLNISLPPLSEQQRIVKKIEAIVKKLKQINTLHKKTYSDSFKLLHSAFNRVIAGADYKFMAEVAPITRRPVKVDMEGEYPELGIRSFGKGTFHKPKLSGMEVGSKKLYCLEPGDLVFNNVFAWEGAITVVQPEDKGRVGSHRFIACVPEEGIATADFLCFYFKTPEGLAKIGEASPGGAGRNRTLGLEKLAKVTVPVPDYAQQLWFDKLQAKVKAVEKLQAVNHEQLEALLPSILDRAFKGEL